MRKKLVARMVMLFALVLAISVAVIYFTFDIRTLDYLTMFRPSCILTAVGILSVGLLFDGLRLITLAKVTDEDISLKQVVNVVLSNYFLALVTPGASGGAIAQVMFMKRAGVPIAKATVIVLVRTIMSINFLILLVPVVFFTDYDINTGIPNSVLILVSLAFISLPVIAFVLMRTEYPEKWIDYCTKKLAYSTRENCFIWYREFKNAFVIMGKHPMMMMKAFVESGISLLCIYATVPAYFSGMNIEYNFIQVMGRMVLINLILYFSPTPGGSGIAEAGFVMLFKNLLPNGLAGIMAVLWRFTAEYLPFILGAAVTIRAFGTNVVNITTIDKNSDEK